MNVNSPTPARSSLVLFSLGKPFSFLGISSFFQNPFPTLSGIERVRECISSYDFHSFSTLTTAEIEIGLDLGFSIPLLGLGWVITKATRSSPHPSQLVLSRVLKRSRTHLVINK
eukprot:TRINITY_DN93080_c0_g1_i1.p1 TRINITY_DN93080_c0_g1~~TRINITY_DN93080_c0_g1_i1.p1  ORF type:complete len:114 (+),score=7.90 TRINITY_DN93080_c0_g1_i1:376-717(+)